jgi:hypothetical protein
MTEDEAYFKAIFQLRSAINILIMPLRAYGQGVYVDGVMEQLVSLAVQFHQKALDVSDDPYYYEPVGEYRGV